MSYREKHPDEQTFQEAFAEIAKGMEKALAEHEIKQLDTNVWFCQKPGTRNMSFYVVRMPGAWAIYGDIGDIFIYCSSSLDWLRGAAESPSYLWEKVPASMKIEEFYPGDALQDLDESDSMFDAQAAEIYERWMSVYEDPRNYEEYSEAVYNVMQDSELAASKQMNTNAIRCVHAARWFCAKMPDELPEPAWAVFGRGGSTTGLMYLWRSLCSLWARLLSKVW